MLFRRGARVSRSGLWTQPLERGEDYYRTVWFEDSFGCELFPLDVYRDCD